MSERSATARSAVPASPAAAAVRATPAVAREPRSARSLEGALDTAAAGAREADAPEPPLPPILPVRRLRADESPPDFSRVANRGIDRIRDPDVARAQATRQLLLQLAPMLGLDPARLRITVSADGGARIEARGANALQDGDEVLLHPGRYRPQTDAGRYLLAHELTHAAQRRLGGAPVRRDAAGQLRAAEDEAARIGRDFVAGRPLQRPRIALRGHVVAADTGATEEVLPALVDSVKTSRSRELAIIRDALDGWWVSDGDVFTVMRILDSVSFPVAVAMVGALSRDERYWLADNVNPPHMYQHRRSVLATYRALEPDRFDAIDLKVMRALPDRGLTVDETEAAVYALEHLSRDRLDALLASEKGDAIARLIGAPLPTPAQRERILDAQRQATKEEAELAKKRERVVALQKDDGVSRIVDAIAERLSAPRDARGEPRHPVAADALAVIEMLSAQLGDNDRFLAIAERMEAKGLIETLLDLTPPERFLSQDDPTASEVLIGLAQSRLPIRNEQLVEDLLSYGLFDWAIRDHEALFAYRLIKLMPMAAQYRFRQRDSGKWYLRLLENLPDDPTTGARRTGLEIRKAESREELERMAGLGASTEVVGKDAFREEETYYYNASEIYERKLAATGVVEARDQLLADFRQARKGIYRDAEAIALYRKLVELGRGTLEPGKESTGDDILRETLIRELDRENMIDELFGELPNDFLFAEENRISTVKIMLSRDSMRVQAHARELVGYGALDWMVKDNEAYLAYLCLKALPAEERSAFVQANPDHWARIQSELDPDARQARDLNLYIGDKAGTDRASVLAQLADAQNWTADNATILDSLLRMAMAMTEHRFAFERSREFNAVADATLAPLVEKYRLWNPAQGREIYRADILKQTRWYEEGLVQSLKSLWGGLVTLWRTDILFVDGKIGAKVDLNDVQDFMGGDLMGARLADPAKRGSRQQGESEGSVSPDANKLTLLLDPEWFGGQGKSAELILPQLLIDSTNVQTEGTTVQTGIVDLKGLHIRAAYDGQNSGQPAQANVSLDSLIVNDLLIARSSRMYTLTRLIVTTLRLAAGTIDSTTGAPPAVREGRYIPFPLLVLMMLPWLAQMAMVALMAIPIRRIEKAADQGLEPDNRFQQDMLTRTKAIDISFAQLKAEGFSSSDGQHVGDVRIDDFALRAGLNKATRLRAELASIEDRLAHLPDTGENRSRREALIARRGELESAQKDIEAQEREYLEIQRRIRAGGLKPEDQKALQQRLDALDFEDTGEVFLDIGHMEASGIRGTVTSRDKIELNNVHGQGGSSALLGMVSGPTATPDALARRAQAGERAPALVSGDRPGDFTLELGDVTTGRLEVGGGVRSVEDIDAQLEDLKKDAQIPELQPLIESLQMLRTKAQRHEAMVAYGVSSLSPAELDEFRALRRLLTADAALIVESIALTRARLHADLASGRIDIGMDKARITGLQLPQKGIQVEEMTASGVRAGAMPASGLLDWVEWKKRLRDADAGIDTLEIRNARSKYHGLLFEKATMTGASVSVKARGDDITLGIGHLAVEGLGLAPRLGLLNRRLSGLRQKVRVAEGAEKTALEDEIGKLSTRIDTLQGLADSRLAAYLRLERAKTPEEIADAEAALHEVDVMIILDFKQYGAAVAELDEFGVNVAGAGDLLSDALGGGIDPLAVLERGVRVTGTGTDQQLFKKLSVRGLETTGEDAKGHLSADAGAFDVTGAKLDLSAKKNGDDIEITVPKFDIEAIDIRDFLLTTLDAIDDPEATGGGLQLWSRGTSHLQKISYSGKVTLASRVKGSRDLSDYRLKHVRIDSFEIGKLIGDGLGLALPEKKIEVDILSGSISGLRGTGVDVEFPEDAKGSTTITGKIDVDAIDQLVVGRAIMDAWSADGTINASKISVGLLEDGGIKASIGDLDLLNFGVRGPDGWVRLSLKDLGGKVMYRDGALDIEDLHFGSLKVSAIHWKVGKTGYIESDRPTTITGLKLKARLETRLKPGKSIDGKPAEEERKLTRVHVDSLDIDKVESEKLIYDDGENHVELREANPHSEWKMTGFKPLFLQNLKVWGLDWTPDTGVSAANGSIGSYAANAHYTGIKSGLLAGIALRGTGMTAEVVGPGAYTLDVGKIEETSGKYDDGKLETDFGTGAIVGKIAIGPDYVEAQNVQIDKTALTSTYYADGPRKVSLTSANVAKITLGSVRQNYLLSTDENNETQKTPGTLEVRDLELFDVKAGYFSYKGESEGKVMKEGVETTEKSTQSVRGDGAWISHMRIGGFVRDPVDSSMTVTGVSVDNGPGAKAGAKPFGVRGLVADLTSTIGTDKTSKYLTTDIEGGPLTAERITFRTVTLGVNTEGPKPEEVTRTEIDGAFNLTHLGLVNPNLTLTDAKGKTTRIHSTDDKSGRVDIAGITPRFMPNGTVALPIKSVIGAGLTVDIGDNKTISLDKLLIEDIAVGLQGMGTDEGLDMLATKIGKIQVDGLKVKIVSRRKAELSDKEYADAMAEYRQAQADAKKDPPGTFIATPLGGLNGKLSGEYSLSPILDPDIDPEFKNGVIDFGGMTYFAVQLHTVDDGKGGKKDVIELGNGISIKTLKDFGRKMPGFYGDTGKYWYGQINIKETVEGLMNEPGSEPSRTYEAASALSNFYGFHGDLSLGSGRMGYDKDGDKALGRGDTWIDLQRNGVASRNTLHMNESNIGERIDLTSPEIYASGAGFTAGKTRKVRLADGTVREAETRIGTTDDISFETVGLQIEGLAHMTLTITLTVQKGTIRNIHIGDLTFADAAGLSTLKAPTLTDVDPKGKPIPMTPPAGGTP